MGDVNKNSTLLNPALNGGHNYFRTWELQRHNQGGRQAPYPLPETATMASETLPRGSMTSPGDDGQYGVRYVEHVYESPTFHRKDIHESEDPAQYYELDPEAEVFTPRHMEQRGPAPLPSANQRCSYPGTNAHEQHMNTAGNYTS